jgi:hypothetical protein
LQVAFVFFLIFSAKNIKKTVRKEELPFIGERQRRWRLFLLSGEGGTGRGAFFPSPEPPTPFPG